MTLFADIYRANRSNATKKRRYGCSFVKVEGHPKVRVRPCHRMPVILPSVAYTATVKGVNVVAIVKENNSILLAFSGTSTP